LLSTSDVTIRKPDCGSFLAAGAVVAKNLDDLAE
jgi:hypothetical protein